MIMLPVAYVWNFNINPLFVIIFLWNVAVHAVFDNMKANKKETNLIQDQICHLVQIITTFVLLVLVR